MAKKAKSLIKPVEVNSTDLKANALKNKIQRKTRRVVPPINKNYGPAYA